MVRYKADGAVGNAGMNSADGHDRRAWEIAAYARRFSLLARRSELASDDRSVRAFHALIDDAPGPLHLYDAALVIGASEADRVCARVVSILSRDGVRPSAQLLAALEGFDFERLAALYFALPIPRRTALRQHALWAARAEALADEERAAALAIEDLVADTPTSRLAHNLARLDVGLCAAS